VALIGAATGEQAVFFGALRSLRTLRFGPCLPPRLPAPRQRFFHESV